MKQLLLLLFFFVSSASAGPIDALQFSDPVQEKRYFALIEELRCLKCQNSNIAGSNAPLAKDLRAKVYDQIVNKGMSDVEIKSWMLARYGDFVLYKPPVKPTTYVLWALPVILGLIGLFLLRSVTRRKQHTADLSQEQKETLKRALK